MVGWTFSISRVCQEWIPIISVPSLQQAVLLVADLKRRVEAFEAQLIQGRIHSAKSRRKNNLQLLFQDCAKDQPSKVDSLVQSVEVGVDSVDPSDCSVVLQKPVTLSHELPLVIGGKSREVLACCEDQVWLSDVTSIQPGDVARQDNVSSSDQAILSKFEAVWEARWNKISHLSQDQWLSINDFIRQRLSPIQWDFPQWDIETLTMAVKGKKRTSATGPDGVSKGISLLFPLVLVKKSSVCLPPWKTQSASGLPNWSRALLPALIKKRVTEELTRTGLWPFILFFIESGAQSEHAMLWPLWPRSSPPQFEVESLLDKHGRFGSSWHSSLKRQCFSTTHFKAFALISASASTLCPVSPSGLRSMRSVSHTASFVLGRPSLLKTKEDLRWDRLQDELCSQMWAFRKAAPCQSLAWQSSIG